LSIELLQNSRGGKISRRELEQNWRATMIQDAEEMKQLTVEDIDEILEELERQGRVKKTGELRNGKPVYVSTYRWVGTA
jgi:hypothetical protein